MKPTDLIKEKHYYDAFYWKYKKQVFLEFTPVFIKILVYNITLHDIYDDDRIG